MDGIADRAKDPVELLLRVDVPIAVLLRVDELIRIHDGDLKESRGSGRGLPVKGEVSGRVHRSDRVLDGLPPGPVASRT